MHVYKSGVFNLKSRIKDICVITITILTLSFLDNLAILFNLRFWKVNHNQF